MADLFKINHGNYNYQLTDYWMEEYTDELYMCYNIIDLDTGKKVSAIDYRSIGTEYLTQDEVNEIFAQLVKEKDGNEFQLLDITQASKLMQYIYKGVCEREGGMCFIEDEEWQDLLSEGQFLEQDLDNLLSEIERLGLEEYFEFSDNYIICGYRGLRGCFIKENQSSMESEYEMEI